MNSIYAIGDVHGHLDKLDQALDWMERDGGKDAPIVFVGDLVDRGPDSRGVIQRVIDAQAQGAIGRLSKAIMTACSNGFCKVRHSTIRI